MSNLTEQQMRFVEAKATGINARQAGLLAGYSAKTVNQATSRLMARADIKAAIRKAKKDGPKAGVDNTDDDGKPRLRDHYESPLDFMLDVMNQPSMPAGLRFEAAKQALPYVNPKITPAGKKQDKKERAKDIASGGAETRGKYQTKRPPGGKPALAVVK